MRSRALRSAVNRSSRSARRARERVVTSPAWTVVDCFRFRNRLGVDIAVEALRDYRRLRKGTVDELWLQADQLRMTRVMRPYWDAIAG